MGAGHAPLHAAVPASLAAVRRRAALALPTMRQAAVVTG
jgi:hypothetical protein